MASRSNELAISPLLPRHGQVFVAAGDAMQEGPVKRAMLKELGDANTAMSKGDMRGACKSYMRTQKMGSTKS